MQDVGTIKILVVDYRVLVGSGISTILERNADFQVVGQATSGEDTIRCIERYSPDIVSIDIDLPDPITGVEVIRMVRRRFPQIRLLVLTNLLDEAIIRDVLRQGVAGYLLKNSSAEELVHAIRSAYRGRPSLSPEVIQILIQGLTVPHDYHLTPREHQVLDLIAQGRNNHEIGEKLNISLSTVQFHVSNILDKLDVHNRIEAAMFAVQHHLAKYPNTSAGLVH